MRTLLLVLLLGAVFNFSYAQYPGCENLSVTNIGLNAEGNLSVTIRNTCYDCTYGGAGCVYNEMKVVKTTTPYDTIGTSGCWCLYWADPNVNGEFQTFTLNTTFTVLPPVETMKILVFGCSCEEIPFSPTLSVDNSGFNSTDIQIFPNPAIRSFTISTLKNNGHIEILDLFGKKVFETNIHKESLIINTSPWAEGIYFIRINSNSKSYFRKIIVTN